MMRSLYSGISGLKVHQTKMDVIGNNISNVSTVGFRGGSVNFTDVFYQTTQNASGPNTATGAAGTNAIQIGLGANVAAITVDLSGTGATQRTDRGMDVMINGDAFLIVRSNGQNYFTKSGALDIDANGTLYCTTNGATVLGWQVDENGDIRRDAVSPLNLMGGENAFSDPRATTKATLQGNVDQWDPQVQYSEDGVGAPTSISFYDNLGQLFNAKLSLIKSAEDSDSSYSVRISDIMGPDGKSILKREILDPDTGNRSYEKTEQSVSFGGEEVNYDVAADGTITFEGTNWPTLTFNGSTGEFMSVSSEDGTSLNLLLNPGEQDNSFPLNGVDIDFSTLTMFATDGQCALDPKRGDAARNYDGAGNAAGSLQGFSLQTDGKIYGVYSNGDKKLLGQIAVATFPNPSGLESVGNSMYAATLNSGEFDGIGVDISEVGKFAVGALEMSDVDLATEFTNMITTQRGFQANSRVITTSDTMLEELVNLKR